jgi:predicted RNA polymerase sigma factor
LYAALGEFYQQAGHAQEAHAYFQRAQSLTRSVAIRKALEKKMKL